MFYARIKKSSPRYRDWIETVGADRVPIVSPFTHRASAPGQESGAQFYRLAITRLSAVQLDRLYLLLSSRFGVTIEEIHADIRAGGIVPVLAEDVVVETDARAFL